MVAYSFRAHFEAPIRAGTKAQTIRADRARHARAGEELQLYTGMRTQHCRLIGRAICMAVSPICINFAQERIEVGARRVIQTLKPQVMVAVLPLGVRSGRFHTLRPFV